MKNLKEYITLVEAEGSSAQRYGKWAADAASGTGDWIRKNVLQPSYNAWGDFLSGVTGSTPGPDWTDSPTTTQPSQTGGGASSTPTATQQTPASSTPSAFGPRGYLVQGENTLALQHFINSRLKQLGISGHDIATDSKFGPKTIDALNLVRSKETDPNFKSQLDKLGANVKKDTPAGAGVGSRAQARTGAGASQTPTPNRATYTNLQGKEVPSNFDPVTGKVIGMPPPLPARTGQGAQASAGVTSANANLQQQMRQLAKTDPDVAAARKSFRESSDNEFRNLINLVEDANTDYADMPPSKAYTGIAQPSKVKAIGPNEEPPEGYTAWTTHDGKDVMAPSGMTAQQVGDAVANNPWILDPDYVQTVQGTNPDAATGPGTATTSSDIKTHEIPPAPTTGAAASTTPAKQSTTTAKPSFKDLGKQYGFNTPEEVKDIQNQLIQMGYDLGSSGADGKFGTKTQTAFKQAYSQMFGQPNAAATQTPTSAQANTYAGQSQTAAGQASPGTVFKGAQTDLNKAASEFDAAKKKLDMLQGGNPAVYEDEVSIIKTLANLNKN